VRPEDFAVFAGVLPEDKYHLVQAFQKSGHTVGMCGDGANDAPALRQAQMGIAVSTATDVAKSAAGIVLTKPGSRGRGRRERRPDNVPAHPDLHLEFRDQEDRAGALPGGGSDHHRARDPDPMLMVIIMITGDFLGMSLTTDNVRPSPTPSAWRVGNLTIAGVFMGISELVFCTAVLPSANSAWVLESRR
jgi:H+-transporting ATPase